MNPLFGSFVLTVKFEVDPPEKPDTIGISADGIQSGHFFGGDEGDRTLYLLNAIQALSRTIGYAPPDGLGKGLNIPLRQLMRDKLQYSMEGICCQLAISNFDM